MEINILPHRCIYDRFKRVFDIVFSVLLLLTTAPIILCTMLAIILESPGSCIYKQERMGKNQQVFVLYKLRSMKVDAEKNGPQWAEKSDTRVTNVGKFLRKTRLDELPQLFNVLKGEMSLIGPRPERPIFIREFSKELPEFKKRTLVKPGLSGLAQIKGGYELSPKEKLSYDLEYIAQYGMKMDGYIFVKTIGIIFTGEGSR